jgi:PadR family transcriptional regulator, regulatory protein PadR
MSRSTPKERVLEAFLRDPTQPQYGYELMKRAGVASGTLYPLLARWERKGLIESRWEAPKDGRPPRKMFQFTGDGVAAARLELAALRLASRPGRRAAHGRPAVEGGATCIL